MKNNLWALALASCMMLSACGSSNGSSSAAADVPSSAASVEASASSEAPAEQHDTVRIADMISALGKPYEDFTALYSDFDFTPKDISDAYNGAYTAQQAVTTCCGQDGKLIVMCKDDGTVGGMIFYFDHSTASDAFISETFIKAHNTLRMDYGDPDELVGVDEVSTMSVSAAYMNGQNVQEHWQKNNLYIEQFLMNGEDLVHLLGCMDDETRDAMLAE